VVESRQDNERRGRYLLSTLLHDRCDEVVLTDNEEVWRFGSGRHRVERVIEQAGAGEVGEPIE
jgi:hypothetical protein